MNNMKMDNFLQSDAWADFQLSLGNKVQRVDGVLTVVKKMSLGFSNLFISRTDVAEAQINSLETYAREAGCDFIRIEPLSHVSSEALLKRGYKKVSDHSPAHTRVADLSMSEDELRNALHQKTRYNIGLAERRGVRVKTAGAERFEDFWNLIAGTYKRHGISTHSKEHYRRMLSELKGASLAIAEVEGRVIAANFLISSGNTLTYLHGGSEYTSRDLMAPQLLQWETILTAKKEGFQFYDFWGIAPKDQPNHPLSGVTRFKQGFPGVDIEYPGTFEKGLGLRYFLYRVLTKFRI